MGNRGYLRTQEIFAMALIIISIKLTDSTPSLLAQKGQNGFWLIPILSFALILPGFLLMIYLLKKYENKNLIELFESILGQWFGKLIGFILFLFAFFAMTLDSRNYVEQIKLLYFPETPSDLIFIIFFGIVFFGAKKGIEVIGFTSWISFFVLNFFTFLIIVLIWGDIVVERIYPIFGSGLDHLLNQGYQKAAMFSEIFFFLIAYQAAKQTEMFRKGIVIAFTYGFFLIILFYFIYVSVFDYNSIQKLAFPFHDITQYVNFGSFFTNIETIFMIFWLIAAYLKFMILLYAAGWIFGTIFNIQNFDPVLLPLAFLVVTIGLMPFNSIMNELVLRETLFMIMSPFFIFLPFLLWGIALMKGDLRK
ncbi:endospore germination permease [Gracilibacillus sp. YIM 98692]|uniref:GerAB/ArcD/ProY family transporter n=1 Tax=Gracilibacillus sp. YIM 98692 TaxID=2663532 RepID=UPI0013D1C55A|nr:endospore germination permease [Gracilibacillus sp. YIM 98692]